jgi:erythritol transport system permease protein
MSEQNASTTPERAAPTQGSRKLSRQLLILFFRFRTLIVLLLLIIVFGYLSPVYLTQQNMIIMSKHVAINAIMAIGMTFVILTGGIDLSVGSIVGLTAMISGGMIVQGLVLKFLNVAIFYRAWVIILIGLALGALLGLFNGLLITRLNVTPFIATLGTLYMARGFAQLRSDGNTFPNLSGNPLLRNGGFEILGGGRFVGVPIPIWIMIVLSLIAIYVTKRTPFGRHTYAIGGNDRAAELSGIPVYRVKTLVYVISGVCAAMAGMVIASELQAAHPATGTSYELNAIAAVVLGGTSLSGGRGSITGSILGAFVIGFLSDGLVILGVSSFWQTVIKGAVIVIAVVLDEFQQRLQRRQSVQRSSESFRKEAVA